MTRDEMFAAVKTAIVDELKESAEEHHLEAYEEAAEDAQYATNLAELAVECMIAFWDLPTFIKFVLANSGWDNVDLAIPFGDWNEEDE